eukprot:TRINITY_DN9022_c0_g1_i3.p1 TRINITY_DN9022_c0_g1~~TRINITY_DN9022_c0_g1_i3.p1  ORF type:complete len:385 (-),score=52.18 TRINITY_DN9022_c0_g1_i3:340-1494(-)
MYHVFPDFVPQPLQTTFQTPTIVSLLINLSFAYVFFAFFGMITVVMMELRIFALVFLLGSGASFNFHELLKDANVVRSQSQLIGQNFGEGSIQLHSDNRALGYGGNAFIDSTSIAKADSTIEVSDAEIRQTLRNTDEEPLLVEDQEEAEDFLRIDKEYVCQHVQSTAKLFVKKAQTLAEAQSKINSRTVVGAKNAVVSSKTGGNANAIARAILKVLINLFASAFNSHIAAIAQLRLELEINQIETAVAKALAEANAYSAYDYGVTDSDYQKDEASIVAEAMVSIVAEVFAAVFNCEEAATFTELQVNTTGTVLDQTQSESTSVFLLKPPPPSPPNPPPFPSFSPPPPAPPLKFVPEKKFDDFARELNLLRFDDISPSPSPAPKK